MGKRENRGRGSLHGEPLSALPGIDMRDIAGPFERMESSACSSATIMLQTNETTLRAFGNRPLGPFGSRFH